VKVLKTPEKEKHALSLPADSTCIPPCSLCIFLPLTFNKPIYTHAFCLDSSTPEHKNQGLLKTPFAINKTLHFNEENTYSLHIFQHHLPPFSTSIQPTTGSSLL
jgi:hypothetical protein